MSIFILEPLLVEDLGLCRQLSVWPSHLRLEIVATGIHALDFQAWILKHRASVVRIQCAADMGEQDFGKLVKSLRDDGRVSHHGSCQACLSQIGRSRSCGLKALRSAVSFWHHFMGAYSVPRSSLLTYPSFRALHRSSRNRIRSRKRAVPALPIFHSRTPSTSSCKEIPAIIRRTFSLLGRCLNRRCRNNSHRNSRRFAYKDRSHNRKLAYKGHCHSHRFPSKERSHSRQLTCKDRHHSHKVSRASGVPL